MAVREIDSLVGSKLLSVEFGLGDSQLQGIGPAPLSFDDTADFPVIEPDSFADLHIFKNCRQSARDSCRAKQPPCGIEDRWPP